MEDLTALAVRLSQSVGDARGVLILSRDGLVLGAHPGDAEARLKVPWLRFASLGEPERGFVQFGGEIWSYVRRGAYAGFVLTGPGVRPGFVLDQIEIALLHAEEARARRDGLRAEPVQPQAAPSGKPRAPLHPEARPEGSTPSEPPIVIGAEAPSAGPASTARSVVPPSAPLSPPSVATVPEDPSAAAPGPAAPTPGSAGGDEAVGTEATEPPAEGPAAAETETERPPAAGVWGGSSEGPEEDEEVDRFSLAREFSQLLQEPDDGADG